MWSPEILPSKISGVFVKVGILSVNCRVGIEEFWAHPLILEFGIWEFEDSGKVGSQ